MKRLFALALAAVAACSVVSGNELHYAGSANRCSSGCPTNSRCTGQTCAASETSYPLLFEVTAPSNGYTQGIPLVANAGIDMRREGAHDLLLPRLARLDVTLCDPGTTCIPGATNSHPAHVRLDRKGALPGTANARIELGASNKNEVLHVYAPPASYDIVVAPADASRAVLPPVVASLDLSTDPIAVAVVPPSASPTFTLTLLETNGKTSTPMTVGRQVSVVEPGSNRPLSSVVDTCSAGTGRSVIKLALTNPLPKGAILRIEPPPAPGCASAPPKPTYEFDLAALDLEGLGAATVTLPVDYAAVPILGSVRKFVSDRAPATSISGMLTLRAISIDGVESAKAGSASLSVRVPFFTGSPFFAFLVPGTYNVDVFPDLAPGTPSAGASTCITCPMNASGGTSYQFHVTSSGLDPTVTITPLQIYSVPPLVPVRGSVLAFDGSPLVPATVQAQGALTQQIIPPRTAPLSARSISGSLVASSQNLVLGLDPGVYDLSIRPLGLSNFPWIVAPGIDVTGPQMTLAPLRAVAPVNISGQVRAPDGSLIPFASIRVLGVLCDSTGKTQISTVAVAEGSSDANGHYELMLPSDLASNTGACL